jgi:hypothetical protein
MGIFADQAFRLTRTKWLDANELAEEIQAIFRSKEPVKFDSPIEISNPTTDPAISITNTNPKSTSSDPTFSNKNSVGDPASFNLPLGNPASPAGVVSKEFAKVIQKTVTEVARDVCRQACSTTCSPSWSFAGVVVGLDPEIFTARVDTTATFSLDGSTRFYPSNGILYIPPFNPGVTHPVTGASYNFLTIDGLYTNPDFEAGELIFASASPSAPGP